MRKSWEREKLGNVIKFVGGGTPSKSVAEYWDGNVPWASVKDFKSEILYSTQDRITELGVKKSSTNIAEKGELLLVTRMSPGVTAITDIRTAINQDIKIVRPISKISVRYLHYYFKSIKGKIDNLSSGSTVKGISVEKLNDLYIRFPNFDEQEMIADILDKAQLLVGKRKEAIVKLDELIQSVFLDMFGDPIRNSLNWDKFKLSEIGTLARGKSKHRPRNAPELLNGKYPLIQTGDVAKADLYIREYEQTYSELGLQQSKMWEKGTLCITIAANIAKTGILTFDSCFPDSVVGFIPSEKSNINYLQIWFLFLQKIIEDAAPESAQKNINLKILGDLDVVLPPIELQNKFSIIVNKIDREKQMMKQSLSQLEGHFQSLLQQVFKEELRVNTEITA
ncbi:restriction endonuclease subunit S [Bacillus mobilis]|uniref:restriction endonuclease subunit S n=1 Tax=Bacillus mobilis TaxID=2026190 RepID=UPI002E1A915A|nr:restriction endonuclease subunit S [Bacillus mobilis]MED0956312.1 restriction endonuclease subunit S [Bacillus mobilis]